ncbi:mechanosensitive ion channel family protein [Fusibacter sp. JL298sf-3]
MIENIIVLERLGLSKTFVDKWGGPLFLIMGFLVAVISYYITKKVVLGILEKFIRRNKYQFDDILLESKFFERLSHFIPVVVLYLFEPSTGVFRGVLDKSLSIYLTMIIILSFDALLNAVNRIYNRYEVSKARPIKGYLQVVKIFVYAIVIIGLIADLMGKSPVILLSSIGAMTAVIMLIFKDSILGLVASIQLAANEMVRIGDWIEMPKYGADGDVIDMSLNTVKVENFDKTVTTIPTYTLISDSVKNWRGVQEAGARRIKRALYIDVNSIRTCDEALLHRFEGISLIRDEIRQRITDLEGREESITNVGSFRLYIQKYLEAHPKIHKQMPIMARHLPVNEKGLPIEVYAFSTETAWAVYEGVQADIFDHLLSVVDAFDLKVFQYPTGRDIATAPMGDSNGLE